VIATAVCLYTVRHATQNFRAARAARRRYRPESRGCGVRIMSAAFAPPVCVLPSGGQAEQNLLPASVCIIVRPTS